MAKQLTFSDATLGWRFSHTNIFLKNFEGQWELLQDLVVKNLDRYWNLDEAVGSWLDQVGQIFGLKRPYGASSAQFVLDVDRLDDPDVVLDGEADSVADTLYRTLIKVRNQQPGKLFCMKSISDSFEFVFGKENVKVEFEENKDIEGNYKPMYFKIILTFKQITTVRTFLGLQKNNPLLLIGKPMGVSYDLFCQYNPDL